MILLSDYFGKYGGHKDVTEEIVTNAEHLLEKVNALLDYAFECGIDLHVNPNTSNYVSGTGLGGFRPQDCAIGAPGSAHKQGRAVDIFDIDDTLDKWLTDSVLEKFDLYRESPLDTRTWCHLTDRAPKSGKRTFKP